MRLSSVTDTLEKDLFWGFYVESVRSELYINKIFYSFAVIEEFIHDKFKCACAGA